jgi:hypothetical protein
MSAYPNIHLHPWKFNGISGPWTEDKDTPILLEQLETKLNIKCKEDWQSVSWEVFESLQVLHTICKVGGFSLVLDKFYPHNLWNYEKIEGESKKAGMFLAKILTNFFRRQVAL